MLCYAIAMLCYCYAIAMLCYAMLCYAMLCYAMLCYAMLCYCYCYDLSFSTNLFTSFSNSSVNDQSVLLRSIIRPYSSYNLIVSF